MWDVHFKKKQHVVILYTNLCTAKCKWLVALCTGVLYLSADSLLCVAVSLFHVRRPSWVWACICCSQVHLPLSWWCSVRQRASGCSATWTTTQKRWRLSGNTSMLIVTAIEHITHSHWMDQKSSRVTIGQITFTTVLLPSYRLFLKLYFPFNACKISEFCKQLIKITTKDTKQPTINDNMSKTGKTLQTTSTLDVV